MDLIYVIIKEEKFPLNSTIKNKKGQIPNIRNLNEYLIWKFIKNPNHFETKDWIKESGIAKKLLKIYPNNKFWAEILLDFQINSLAWFLTYDGKEFLRIENNKFNLDLSPEKVYN